uniref:Uncharacterized protein n=1 Tax=Ditylenchus dipsaci TaxID=166011 RepID=A0A915DY41_9BILA
MPSQLPVWLAGMQNALACGLYWQLNGLGLMLMTGEFIGGVITEICSTSTMSSLKGSSTTESRSSESKFSLGDSQSATTSSAAAVLNAVLSKPSKTCPDFKDDENQSACCRSRITQGAFFCCTQEYRAQIEWEEHKQAWRQFFQSHVSELVIGSIILAILMCFLMSFLCKRMSFCPMYQPKLFDPIGGGRCSSRYPTSSPTNTLSTQLQVQKSPVPTLSSNTSAAAAALSADLMSSTTPTNGTTAVTAASYSSGMLQGNKPPTLYEESCLRHRPSNLRVCHIHFRLPFLFSIQHNLISLHGRSQAAVVVVNPQQRLHDWDCLIENEVNGIRQATHIDQNQPNT